MHPVADFLISQVLSSILKRHQRATRCHTMCASFVQDDPEFVSLVKYCFSETCSARVKVLVDQKTAISNNDIGEDADNSATVAGLKESGLKRAASGHQLEIRAPKRLRPDGKI